MAACESCSFWDINCGTMHIFSVCRNCATLEIDLRIAAGGSNGSAGAYALYMNLALVAGTSVGMIYVTTDNMKLNLPANATLWYARSNDSLLDSRKCN